MTSMRDRDRITTITAKNNYLKYTRKMSRERLILAVENSHIYYFKYAQNNES
jgi:hypothetical protein